MTVLSIPANIELLTTDKQFQKAVLKELRIIIPPQILKASRAIQAQSRVALKNELFSDPEYHSITRGKLAGELGIPDARSRVDNLIETFISLVQFKVGKTRLVDSTNLVVKAELEISRENIFQLFRHPDAFYVTDKNLIIPWVQWWLVLGDRIIVRGWDVVLHRFTTPPSRSGLGLMVKGRAKRWRPSRDHSRGTLQNNFFINAVNRSQKKLELIFAKELAKVLK